MNRQIYQKPPGQAGFYIEIATAEFVGAHDSSFEDARETAIENALGSGYAGAAPTEVSSCVETIVLDHQPKVTVQLGRYKPIGYSATCYVKLWWDEVAYEDVTGVSLDEVSRTSKDWTMGEPGHNGVCLGVGFDQTDVTTWPEGDVIEVPLPVPSVDPSSPSHPPPLFVGAQVNIEKVRWSFVVGYIPPEDGSANGFPKSASRAPDPNAQDEGDSGDAGDTGSAGDTGAVGDSGTAGLTSGGLGSGGLTSGGLTSGGLTSGGLTSGGLTSGGLTTGGLTSGGLTSGGLTSGGLTSGGLTGGGLTSGGLTGGGLETGGLTSGGLTGGGLSTGALGGHGGLSSGQL